MVSHEDSVYVGHMLDMTRRAVQAIESKSRTDMTQTTFYASG